MGHIIELRDLTKYYGRNRGIEHLTLNVEQGEIFGFIGPNGAGKSTAIRTMLGLLKPNSGSVKIFGKSMPEEKTEILKDIGYLPSEPVFYSGMRVRDAIRFALSFYGRMQKEEPAFYKACLEEADGLCERLKLDAGKRVEELSLGNRKKAGIVCALAHRAKLYILDEPTSGLDPLMQREFFEILQEKNEAGAAIFLSSHVLGEIQRYCHRAAVIREGKLVVADNVANICGDSVKKVTLHGLTELPDLGRMCLPDTAVSGIEIHGDTVSFLYSGDIHLLLSALSRMPLADAAITEPPLEETFLHFYS
ncbi:MAG: ABC transporter ATP-binding protein [Eubacteriales bacterium]|nr:ABC transporter ATP-binding protein [Eubacteriales bacterium]